MEGREQSESDELVDRLREAVEERRATGQYPAELESQLSEHFERVLKHRSKVYFPSLREALSEIYSAMGFDPDKITTESTVAGGAVVHQAMARLTARQTQGVLDQVFVFAKAVYSALQGTIDAMEEIWRSLTSQIEVINERLASYERVPEDAPAALRELGRKLERIEAELLGERVNPWFSSSKLDRYADGDPSGRYAELAGRFRGKEPVLEIGCGNGWFLELLRDAKVSATGIEEDRGSADEAKARGLDVKVGDLLNQLFETQHSSLGGVALIQVVQRLGPQKLNDLVFTLREKMRPGGLVVVETPDPSSLSSGLFFRDPRNRRPVHPDYLHLLFDEAGFSEVVTESAPQVPGDEPASYTLSATR